MKVLRENTTCTKKKITRSTPTCAPRFFPRYCFLVCRNQVPQNRLRVFVFRVFVFERFYVFQKHYVFLHCFDQIAKIEVALDIDFPKMGSAFFSAFLFFGMQNASSQKWAPRFFRVLFFSEHHIMYV